MESLTEGQTKIAEQVTPNYDNEADVIHEDSLFNIQQAWLPGVTVASTTQHP
jgi:hypothetical protein